MECACGAITPQCLPALIQRGAHDSHDRVRTCEGGAPRRRPFSFSGRIELPRYWPGDVGYSRYRERDEKSRPQSAVYQPVAPHQKIAGGETKKGGRERMGEEKCTDGILSRDQIRASLDIFVILIILPCPPPLASA